MGMKDNIQIIFREEIPMFQIVIEQRRVIEMKLIILKIEANHHE
jgi:hypothetical protein